jgi:hypothetical protein
MTDIARGRNAWRDVGKPRKYRTDKTCKNKRYFSDEALARASAQATIQEVGNVKKLWVYRCQHCPGFHLTSHNQGPDKLVTAVSPA